jgi:hypothetical protein
MVGRFAGRPSAPMSRAPVGPAATIGWADRRLGGDGCCPSPTAWLVKWTERCWSVTHRGLRWKPLPATRSSRRVAVRTRDARPTRMSWPPRSTPDATRVGLFGSAIYGHWDRTDRSDIHGLSTRWSGTTSRCGFPFCYRFEQWTRRKRVLDAEGRLWGCLGTVDLVTPMSNVRLLREQQRPVPLVGIIELVVGVGLVAGGTAVAADRSAQTTSGGPLLIGAGLVAAIMGIAQLAASPEAVRQVVP